MKSRKKTIAHRKRRELKHRTLKHGIKNTKIRKI